ncbi:carbohydrate ABC transporter permease [Amycolatopsis tolypomycina]|uniref:Carbohydrate ABC transporter membrane protein 2, CUT1 family n=1 Tax=Amycolatopsis tolypomycina TaxID=208445 RepID=A0A1H4SQQ1_9PSEU|nr:carbohydrate ABC transporter permease [Amycolatopsis tolypomycina]SEC46328.1 carbohydrate ABC transporter membrane protein 2, CUT1 family [Amycolatopsis tolypomycina]
MTSARMTPGRWAIWALLLAGGLVMVFPVYWMFATAFAPRGSLLDGTFRLWPPSWTLDNLREAVASQPVGRWAVNSVLTTVAGVAITVLVSLLAGYAFAKYRFRGRNVVFLAILLTIMVPIQVIMVPEFLVVAKLDLVGTLWAVILPRAAEGIAVFIARQFMLGIPDELLEAARLDGAGELTVFRRVVLPLCGPLVGVLVIVAFVWRWNDLIWPLVALKPDRNYTLPLGLQSMHGTFNSPIEAVMAVSVLSMVPVIVVFLVFQRRFVQGITSTGLR